MSILQLAEADLGLTLEASSDFGRSITLTDPLGASATLTGQYGDVTAMALLEDEIPVDTKTIHISLRISSIRAAGLQDPRVQEQTTDTPWKITVTDINGDPKTYKLSETKPDNTLGVMTALVEYLDEETP